MAYGRTNASGAAIGAWRFAFADVLPETVLHNTFLAVTGIPAPAILLSDAAPQQPADGELWFQISDPADGLVMSSTAVPFRVLGAYQWSASGSVWTLLTAYYTYLGTWRKLPGLPPIGTALADCSWAQIDRICKAGKAEEYFCVGDTKDIVLSTAEKLTLRIIGFNHDDLAVEGSGKAAITFDTADCMNARAARTSHAYLSDSFYPTLTKTIFGTLPADLRAVMKTVRKDITSTLISHESIFLLSVTEIAGIGIYGGTQYAFYTNAGSKIKRVQGIPSVWHTRNQGANSAWLSVVTASGGADTGTAAGVGDSLGISFALCV